MKTVSPYKIYEIENIENPTFPTEAEQLTNFLRSEGLGKALIEAQERYLSWAEFRKKSWVPSNKEHIWAFIKIQRRANNRQTPITDQAGKVFGYNPNSHLQFLHQVDLELGGNMIGLRDFGEGDKRQIIRRNLIEESIASSKLEGANTSREAARRMLNEGRAPKDKGEQMIVNNHRAMVRIEEEIKLQNLSIDLLKELHREVTKDTLSDPKLEGELRETFDSKGNRLKIMPWDEVTIAYVAPDKEFVERELPKLIKFANDEDGFGFIHPLFKAILLHFWIGLLHPFEDGNGRLARILFYWYMLRKGYWAFSYLSLSERILKSPSQYAMAYVNAEQDGQDLNYFIQYNISKLKLARQELQKFLGQKVAENRRAVKLIQQGHNFNPRQIRLLQYLIKDEQRMTTPTTYHNVNSDIGFVTAMSDLKKLLDSGFLQKNKAGRNAFYMPTPKARELFK